MNIETAINLFLGEQILTTQRSYKYVLRHLATHLGPARNVASITPVMLIEYGQIIRNTPTIKSPATINKYVKTVKTFFNWCVKIGIIPTSPATALKRARQYTAIPKDKAMSEEHYQQMLEYLRLHLKYQPERFSRDYALVLFLGDTGCRIGGCANLKIEHINLSECTATVTEKGQPPRPVFFGEETRRALIIWLSYHSGSGFVFSKNGKRLANRTLSGHFRRITERAHIPPAGPHSLRHRKGHQMADSGTAPTIAAQVLGHQSPSITLEYYYPRDWDRVKREALRHAEQQTELKILRIDNKLRGTS